jgi:hypothetical protein
MARGGIEPPTRGFSVPKLGTTIDHPVPQQATMRPVTLLACCPIVPTVVPSCSTVLPHRQSPFRWLRPQPMHGHGLSGAGPQARPAGGLEGVAPRTRRLARGRSVAARDQACRRPPTPNVAPSPWPSRRRGLPRCSAGRPVASAAYGDHPVSPLREPPR